MIKCITVLIVIPMRRILVRWQSFTNIYMAGYLRSEPCVLGPYLCKGSSFRPYSCSVSLTLFLSPSYFDDLRESLETSQEIVQVQSYNSSVPGDQCMLEEKFLSAFAFSPRTCTNLCLESTVRVLPQPHRSVLNYFLILYIFPRAAAQFAGMVYVLQTYTLEGDVLSIVIWSLGPFREILVQ